EQTLTGMVMTVPYVRSYPDTDGYRHVETNVLNITPDDLCMQVNLIPEERYYGIFKTIVYRSEIHVEGSFSTASLLEENREYNPQEEIRLLLGIADFKGITSNVEFLVGRKTYTAKPAEFHSVLGPVMEIILDKETIQADQPISFTGDFSLKGSVSMNFIPLGKTTRVEVQGGWKNVCFTGDFAPEYTLTRDGFTASWSIMNFNRNLPAAWQGNAHLNLEDSCFGVNLITPVDHYQQSMRSAKYAFMFIALTFVVFFFVELLTHKRIHIIQYLLVGIALILFYTLLLSMSEHISFALSYLIAALATIGLIGSYGYTIFRNKVQTAILTLLLIGLYSFLYVTLQMEDIALLMGSTGLFIILAVIMYFSRKINWYKEIDN
ncbi:MAG: cell envelope integrity protein CreD, partial [Tannerellaceae bacterium]|nr:cell envelope integrity protein CreD [Tannerellaceae bacterium]